MSVYLFNTAEGLVRNTKNIFLPLASALVSLWLCISAYNASTILAEPVSSFDPKSAALFSAFNDRGKARQIDLALESNAKELRDRLSFMVFEKERIDTQIALTQILKQQVNRAPFSSVYWRDLVFVQQDLELRQSEYQTLFTAAKRLSRWNVNERVILLNRCVKDYQTLNQISPRLCADLFANIPMQDNAKRLSIAMGVDHDALLRFFDQVGITLSEGAKASSGTK